MSVGKPGIHLENLKFDRTGEEMILSDFAEVDGFANRFLGCCSFGDLRIRLSSFRAESRAWRARSVRGIQAGSLTTPSNFPIGVSTIARSTVGRSGRASDEVGLSDEIGDHPRSRDGDRLLRGARSARSFRFRGWPSDRKSRGPLFGRASHRLRSVCDSLQTRRISARISRRNFASKFERGSSRRRARGRMTSARAKATRCC